MFDPEQQSQPQGGSAPGRFIPRVTPWDALKTHWPLAAGVTALVVVISALVAISIPATYTAESRLAVGRFSTTTPGVVATFATATAALASQYSRAVDAEPVVNPMSRRLNVSPKTLRSRLSANPIPDSPVFRIQAKGKTADEARLLANGASNELIRYSTELNRSNPDASRLFREFQRAAQVLHERRVERNRVRDATGPDRTDVEQRQLVRAETRQDAAQLRYETVRNAYKGSQESQASTALVQILTKATDADSNRGRVLQVLLFIGLVGGLVLGVTLATLRANRVIRQQVLRQSA